MSTTTATIVLAAGASSRMGSPKALLSVPKAGQSFLRRVIETAMAAGASPVLVVLGHHAEAIRAATPLDDVQIVENPHPERGMLSSLKCALMALPEHVDAVLAWPVDHPLVRASAVHTLLEAQVRHPGKAIVPRFDGRGGHPTLFPRTLFAGLLGLPDEAGARGLFDRQPLAVVRVDVDDPGVVHDVDTPKDYARLGG